jgi:hypothetical protein
MLALLLHLVLALYLTASPSLAQPIQERYLALVRNAAPGETATGEVVREEGEQLQLNTTPCNRDRTVVIFRKPYTKESAGTINCKGVVRNLTQAVKR